MDADRRRQLTIDFEKGKLKKVICTTVWNVGVSFNALSVLIRADGGSSPINDVQIPGRVSRISADKPYGVVHDYLDQFDKGMRQKAAGRAKSYKSNSWEQVFPVKTRMGDYLT
jgi:superfamily II DNA or RNA helicase